MMELQGTDVINTARDTKKKITKTARVRIRFELGFGFGLELGLGLEKELVLA